MKTLISSLSLITALLWTAILPTTAQVNVTQEHNNLSATVFYIDSNLRGQLQQSLTT
jgi:hypothetical protein